MKEKIIEHKSFEESELLGKREEDGDNIRNRLESFMEKNDSLGRSAEENNEGKGQKEKEEKLLKDQSFINQNLRVVNEFKAARNQSQSNEIIRNMTFKEVVCEFDEEVPIEETLRNTTQQIYEEICNHSQEVKQYKEWGQKKRTLPIKQPTKVNQPVLNPLAETNTQEGYFLLPYKAYLLFRYTQISSK